MLHLLATTLATVAGVMLFSGDFTRLFFLFPTYQITSFKVVDYSLSLPSWTGINSRSPQSFWSLYEGTFCTDNNRWKCILWDWDGFSRIINSIETDIISYVTNRGEEKPTTLRGNSYRLSAEIIAGISVNNRQNSIGAHVHRVILDIYHSDREDELVNIGTIHDRARNNVAHTSDSGSLSQSLRISPGNAASLSRGGNSRIITDQLGNATKCFVDEEAIGFESPSFSILPRQITHTVDDAIVIHLKSISPEILLNMAYQYIRNGKVLHITSSAVVYLKTLTSPMSITAGAICDNSLKFTPPPIAALVFGGEKTPWINIDEVDCTIEKLSRGWRNTTRIRSELKELLLSRHDSRIE